MNISLKSELIFCKTNFLNSAPGVTVTHGAGKLLYDVRIVWKDILLVGGGIMANLESWLQRTMKVAATTLMGRSTDNKYDMRYYRALHVPKTQSYQTSSFQIKVDQL